MDYISVGKILNFHGIAGEAKVGYSKGQEDFLKSLKSVYVKQGENYSVLKISSIRFHKGSALIKFEGINSINELIPYKGVLLFIEKAVVKENLANDEFLIEDLTGLDVFDVEGKKIGTVLGVSTNGTSDLISVKSKSKKVCLVPFVKELVPEVDIQGKKIVVNNIEGLVE